MVNNKEKAVDLTFLDGVRGLCALYVAIGHSRWLLWEGYAGFVQHKADVSFWYTVQVYFWSAFKFGHQAVLLFFVLSGFVIHLKYARKISETGGSDFEFWSYLKKRAKRIYPPFIFALFLTLTLDTLGEKVLHLDKLYTGQTPYELINHNVTSLHSSITVFIGNILFLEPYYFPAFGTNGPLWSLGYEWWFYLAYPIFLWLSVRSISRATIVMVVLFILSFFPGLWPVTLFRFLFSAMLSWWLGVLLADAYTGRIQVNIKWIGLLLLCLPVGIAGIIHQDVLTDLVVALGFTGLMAVLLTLGNENVLVRQLVRFKWLGDCSYTLYVTHFPIIALLSAFIIQKEGNLPAHFYYFYGGLFLVVTLAWIFHWFTEKPFIQNRTHV